MASDVFLSDEYGWSSSTGLFEWVLTFLLQRVNDPATQEEVRFVRDHGLGSINLDRLPAKGRAEVLQALRTELVAAADANPNLIREQPYRRRTIGHVKILKLMADDVVRQDAARGV